jgi:ATPase subunit of ABC transporter with duplicated ATPase domains
LEGVHNSNCGNITSPVNGKRGYVPQIIENFASLHAGQRFNKLLTWALSIYPNIPALEEPTNHLDIENRKSLLQMLQFAFGTLIFVSHDTELLRNCIDTGNRKIPAMTGNCDNLIQSTKMTRLAIEVELSRSERQKKDIHVALMREEQPVAKSKTCGNKRIEQNRWLPGVGDLKANDAETVAGKNNTVIENKTKKPGEQLSNLRISWHC